VRHPPSSSLKPEAADLPSPGAQLNLCKLALGTENGMPGRHKQVPGAIAEPPLSRQHARVASSTLRRLWDPVHGLPDPRTKALLVEQINAALVQAGLSAVYTERKLSDAVSNRMYTARRKMRERESMMCTQSQLCGMKDGGDNVAGCMLMGAAAYCTTHMPTQTHVMGAAPMGGCCADLHQPAATAGMPRHNDNSVDMADDGAPQYDALPGDEFFAELDIDQLPTPPSSPPTSPSLRWPMMHDRGGPDPLALAPAWAPSLAQQQPPPPPIQPDPTGGSCMDVGANDLSGLSALDCHAGLSSSWDWNEKELGRVQTCMPMDECGAAVGQCASAA